MKLHELDLTYFEATLIPPVRQLSHVEKPDILLEDYLRACDEKYHLLESHQQFIAVRLFLSGDDIHVHAVLWYSHPDRCLVLVLNRLTETILGHHFLDLPDLPEDHTCPVPKPTPPPLLFRPEAKELPKN